MGGTIKEQLGKQASNIGIPSVKVFKINLDSGEAFSEPILLEGSKVVSLHSPDSLTSTDITLQGTNFSSNPNKDEQKNGFVIPLAADFDDLYDQSDAIIALLATTGEKVWALPELGFPLWVRLKLSVAQTKTLYLSAKG